MVLEAVAISCAIPIVMSHGPLTIPIVKGCCTCDRLLHTFIISVFNSIKKNFTTIKHTWNESVNIIEGCNVAFDTNDGWNFQKSWLID